MRPILDFDIEEVSPSPSTRQRTYKGLHISSSL